MVGTRTDDCSAVDDLHFVEACAFLVGKPLAAAASGQSQDMFCARGGVGQRIDAIGIRANNSILKSHDKSTFRRGRVVRPPGIGPNESTGICPCHS